MLHNSHSAPIAVNDRQGDQNAHAGSEWTIREIASEYDVTPRTLRFYEDKGLITPRRAGANRVYSAKDKSRLEQILRAKRLGFSLDDIADFQDVIEGRVLGRSDLLKRKKAYLRMVERLDRQREDIDIVTKGLERTAARIQTYVDDPARNAAIFNYAEAYDAVFKQHMDDDFSNETAGLPGTL